MYTSDIKQTRKRALKTALIYLTASVICAVFGAIYESFSHGVYSGFMIYAFAFPLILGTLPFLLLSFTGMESGKTGPEKLDSGKSGPEKTDLEKTDFGEAIPGKSGPGAENPLMICEDGVINRKKEKEAERFLSFLYPGRITASLYHCGIITMTTGSLLTGVLEIYGTTNVLSGVYWIVGAALLLTAAILYLASLMRGRRRPVRQ